MPLDNVPTIEESIDIDAPPAKVWALVSELKNMPRWSPQTAKSFVRGGGPTKADSRLININRRGFLVWPTNSKVVRFEPEQEIAWRIKDNYMVWSYTLEPTAAGGTTLTSRREAPEGISDISVRLTKLAMGGVDNFAAELKRDMATTLTKIKADAER
ncbi:MAG TPA: SRPBCC family protein [Marmoricola sp.]